MKKSTFYILWGVAYGVCLAVSFVPDLAGFWRLLAVLLGIIFFVPPICLAVKAKKENNRKALLALRWISGGVLALSTVLLVLNFLSVNFSAQAGLVLYALLVLCSVPMVCVQYWFLGLFLWACLLMLTLPGKAKPKM